MQPIRMPDDYYEQTPDADILATEAVMNTIRTADLLFDKIGKVLRPLGVSSAGGLVLGLLRDHGSLSPSEIGERLIVTRATVTGLLDSLEKNGLVKRTPNPQDRRGLMIEITSAGLKILAKVRTVVHAEEKRWMSALDERELKKLISLLHVVQASVAEPATSSRTG
jgi:DNA-binding MarR family transcriptional regulator